MKMLVTGGGGFLGRHVTREAVARGHEVVVLSRHPERLGKLPRGARALAGDLCQPASLAPIRHLAPAAVVHAAAVVTDDDPRLREVNVHGTEHLIALLTSLDSPPRVVAISSFAVEDIPPTPYSESKLEAERLLRDSGLPLVVLRPALIYGPGDGTNTPALVERLRAGSHWIPGGGRHTRIQPVHVDDVARAVVKAAEAPGLEQHTYRLAGPTPLTVRAWREAVRRASGGRAVIRTLPLPLFGLAARALAALGRTGPLGVYRFHRADHAVDIHEAREDLGFQPRTTEQGLAGLFEQGRLISDSPARPSLPAA